MKKVILSIILTVLTVSIVGCQGKTEDKISQNIQVKEKNNLSVEIIATNDSNSYEGLPIIFTPKVNGEYDKELQYHWILENEHTFQGLVTQNKGLQNEIINSGEPVELELYADVSWVEGTVEEYKVKLQIEDKETLDIIATDEIIVVNNQGTYSIKE